MQASPALLPAQLPPGPRGLPMLGSLPFLVKAPSHHSLNRLSKQYGDVCLSYIGNVPTVVISHPRLMAEALEQAETRDGGIALHIGNEATRAPRGNTGEEKREQSQSRAPHGDRWLHLHRFATEKLFGPEALRMRGRPSIH